jgi:hypothetical protein
VRVEDDGVEKDRAAAGQRWARVGLAAVAAGASLEKKPERWVRSYQKSSSVRAAPAYSGTAHSEAEHKTGARWDHRRPGEGNCSCQVEAGTSSWQMHCPQNSQTRCLRSGACRQTTAGHSLTMHKSPASPYGWH